MKLFLRKVLFLIIIPGAILFSIILVLPAGESYQRSMFYTFTDKNKLLQEKGSPRIIFIGGSNLPFGLDSKQIKDSLNVNPINTGIHASLGLRFMLLNAQQYLRENDVVVISSEYQQFYDNFSYGEMDLLFFLNEVSNESVKLLDFKHRIKLCKHLPEFVVAKLKAILRQDCSINDSIGKYDRAAFNSFGDAERHWNLPQEKFTPQASIGRKFDDDIIRSLLDFNEVLKGLNGKLLITFPCYQNLSYENSKDKIKVIEEKLRSNGLLVMSTPERYVMDPKYMFDTDYHLTKEGVELRTSLLIEDIASNLEDVN